MFWSHNWTHLSVFVPIILLPWLFNLAFHFLQGQTPSSSSWTLWTSLVSLNNCILPAFQSALIGCLRFQILRTVVLVWYTLHCFLLYAHVHCAVHCTVELNFPFASLKPQHQVTLAHQHTWYIGQDSEFRCFRQQPDLLATTSSLLREGGGSRSFAVI